MVDIYDRFDLGFKGEMLLLPCNKLTLYGFRYCDGKIDVEVVAAVASYLKDSLDKEGIKELISNHSKYKGQ